MSLGCATALTACGGGGGGAPAAVPAPQAQSAPAKSVAIYCDGDSTLWGARAGAAQAPHNQCAEIQIDLQSAFGPGVTVENHAVPGTTAADSLNGTNGDTPLAARLAASSAQIVVGNFAINDSQKFSTTEYGANLTAWITAVRAAGKIPVLIEPNPTNLALAPWTANLSSYVAIMDYEAGANTTPLVSQFDYIRTSPDWQSMLSDDGIHPGDDLYKLMGDRDAAVLAQVVKMNAL